MPFDNAAIEARRCKLVQAFVPVLALLAGAISLSILILWVVTSATQQREWSYLFLMKSDTALCFLALSIGLYGVSRKTRAFDIIGGSCAFLVIAFTTAMLTQRFAPIDLGIDQWIGADHSTDELPGRTSVGLAMGLLLPKGTGCN